MMKSNNLSSTNKIRVRNIIRAIISIIVILLQSNFSQVATAGQNNNNIERCFSGNRITPKDRLQNDMASCPAGLEIDNCFDEIISYIFIPNNSIELLRNIKFIIDKNLLLASNFYAPSVLERTIISDASLVIRNNYRKDGISIRLNGGTFGYKNINFKTGEAVKIGSSYGGGFDMNIGNGKKKGILNFSFRESGISFHDIEHVFGNNWSFSRIAPLQPPPPPQSRYGNYLIEFKHSDCIASGYIRASFNPNGELAGLLIELTEK